MLKNVIGKNWPVITLGLALLGGLVAPFADRSTTPGFYVEVLLGGLMAGVLYSLVALGFALIFKASGVFNFAQGAMVFLAALTFVSLLERGVNFWLAIAITLAVMVVLGIAIVGLRYDAMVSLATRVARR